MIKRPHSVHILLIVFALASYWLMSNKKWRGGDNWDTVICSDGRGYYAWLPATFIYNDFNFSFADSVEHLSLGGGCLQDYRNTVNNKKVDKYYPGTAICMLPFFAAAHLYCTLTDLYPANGYSMPYFWMISLAGWVFLQLGLWFTNKVLQELAFSNTIRFGTLLFLMLGSNLISYGVDQPSYSHIYSFTVVAAATLYCLRAYKQFNSQQLLVLFFLAGLIVVMRPINLLFLMLLMVFLIDADARKTVLKQLTERPLQVVWYGLSFAIMPLLMLFLFYQSTGGFVLYSYTNERFDFAHPNTFKFLFSQDNGMVLYTPLLALSMLGGLFSLKSNKPLILSILVLLAITIYVHSSWWCWWYGHGFGSRTLLDFNVLFAILMAYSLSMFTAKGMRMAVFAVFALSCFLTLILYHQAGHGYLNAFPRSDYFETIAAFFTGAPPNIR